MLKLFRSVEMSILFLLVVFYIQKTLDFKIWGFCILAIVTATYVSHIVRSKLLLQKVNIQGARSFSELSKSDRSETNLKSALQTLIVSSLLIFSMFVSIPYISGILYLAGGIFLLYSHTVKNREEYLLFSI
ncbi:hypothetical protein CYJ37_23235 [Bacillus sp. UMB0728]|nr:hypothetical protein CYJ37_23235 [Bacillus sp. UMB0728]